MEEYLQMNISDYKSGVFVKQYGYESFSPELIDHEWLISDPRIGSVELL